MWRAKLLGLLAVVTLSVAASDSAQAQYGWGGWGGYGGGYPGMNYSIYTMDRVPHFALNPPVYYSQPVSRSYGVSPFPYPSTILHQRPVQQVTIENPYVGDDVAALPANVPAAKKPEPLLIRNPYVK